MKTVIAMLVFVAIAMSGAVLPSIAAGVQSTATVPQAAIALPRWKAAQAVALAAHTDIAKGGILAAKPHVLDLEQVLAHADRSFAAAVSGSGTIYVLADGQAEADLAARNSGQIPGAAGRKVMPVGNPYRYIGFVLGSYYNEIGRSTEALRVLDAGLALPGAVPGMMVGEQLPELISERGAALNALKRWPDALAAYDSGLTIEVLKAGDRGRLLRGRGFALTELDRLDEAEAAYRESLTVEPNNTLALKELNYIARIRTGAARSPSVLLMPGASKPR